MAIRSRNFSDSCHLGSAISDRGPSKPLWDSCPWFEIQNNPFKGYYYCSDFLDGNYTLAVNQGVTHLESGMFGITDGTAGSAIAMLTDETTGVVALKSTTTTEDIGLFLGSGLGSAPMFEMTSGKRFWAEARLKKLTTAGSDISLFFGLCNGNGTNASVIATNGTMVTTVGYAGFRCPQASATLSLSAQTGSATALTINSAAGTMTADTYKKLGLYCDGAKLYGFVDGAKIAPVDGYSIATTDFPDAVAMGMHIRFMDVGGDTEEVAIDWLRVAYEY